MQHPRWAPPVQQRSRRCPSQHAVVRRPSGSPQRGKPLETVVDDARCFRATRGATGSTHGALGHAWRYGDMQAAMGIRTVLLGHAPRYGRSTLDSGEQQPRRGDPEGHTEREAGEPYQDLLAIEVGRSGDCRYSRPSGPCHGQCRHRGAPPRGLFRRAVGVLQYCDLRRSITSPWLAELIPALVAVSERWRPESGSFTLVIAAVPIGVTKRLPGAVGERRGQRDDVPADEQPPDPYHQRAPHPAEGLTAA